MRFPMKTGTRFSESESETMHAFSDENWNTFFWNRNQNRNRKRCMRFPVKTGTRFSESESESESESKTMHAFSGENRNAFLESESESESESETMHAFSGENRNTFFWNRNQNQNRKRCAAFMRHFPPFAKSPDNAKSIIRRIRRFRMRENPGFCRNTICLPFLAFARCGDISAY